MKRIAYWFTGFFAGMLLLTLTGASAMNNQAFLVSESKYNLNETVDKIEEIARANGWNISHIYNLQATMEKHSLQVDPVLVLSLCKPQLAYKILGSDNERHSSVFMPCRVSVYQDKDGKVMISRMNVQVMSGMFQGITREAMVMAGTEIEEFLKQVSK